MTVISFLVKVQVLSAQMISTDPRVSTEGSLRTRAFLRTIRLTPRLRASVTTAGNHSGIAATPRATAAKNASVNPTP